MELRSHLHGVEEKGILDLVPCVSKALLMSDILNYS
jgi:hypothetical protein